MLRNLFQEKLKQAMHARDELTTSTLRLIVAAMKDRDIAARAKGNWDGITEDEILSMLQTMIKQRQESIKMYEAGKRIDLAEREAGEIKIIENFLPKQLSEDEIRTAIDKAISATSAAGLKDMGKVMGLLKPKLAGRADMGKVSGLIKTKLSAK